MREIMKRYEIINMNNAAIERIGIVFPKTEKIVVDLTQEQVDILRNTDNISVMECECDYIEKKGKKK